MKKSPDENLNFLESENTDLIEVIKIIWRKKISILFLTIGISSLSALLSLFLSDVYKSEAILAPAADDGNELSSLTDSLGGLVGLSQLPLMGGNNKVSEAIEIMNSLGFYENMSSKNNLFFELNASKGWNKKNNELQIDKNIYDIKNNRWVSTKEFSIDGKPSLQSAHREFLENFKITKNNRNGFITLTMEHYSPEVAKKTLDTIIEEINFSIKEKEIELAENSISYLTEEASKTLITEVKRGIYGLIESQVEKIALANSSPEYVFKILSKPISPEKKFKYSRLFIIISAGIFAMFFSIIYYSVKETYFSSKS